MTGLRVLGTLAVLLTTSWGCGHKSSPTPPPLRHPAASRDLVVQQRGDEFLLSFGYPQTTVSGTPLEPLQGVEIWELVRPVPDWVPPSSTDEPENDLDAADESDEDAATDLEAEGLPATGPDVFERSSGSGDDPSRPDDEPNETTAQVDEVGESSAGPADATDDEAEGEEEIAIAPEPVRPSDEKLLAVDGGEFIATAQLRATIEGADLTAASFGDRLVITLPVETPGAQQPEDAAEDPLEATAMAKKQPPRFGSIFSVKTSVGGRFISNFSTVAVIAHRTAPPPPAGFVLEPDQDKITMTWQVDDLAESVSGFHVYRRDAQSPSYGPPLAFVPLQDPLGTEEATTEKSAGEPPTRDYSDRSAQFDQRYIYALTTVSHRAPVVESAIVAEREIDYADRFAPRPPGNLITFAEAGRIQLLWNASPEADVVGYFVSRRGADGSFIRLSEEPVADREWSDRDVQSGRRYAYRVTAVDSSDNESAPSKVVEVSAP